MFDRHVYRLFFVLLILPLSACAGLRYSAEPIEAWVVDAETKQPLEGVIVVAAWELEATGLYWDTEKWELAGSIHQGHTVGALQVFEAVTDHNGRFFFPAWGPLKARHGILTDSDPALLLFKSGYKYESLSNSLYTGGLDRERVLSPMRWSNWNGKTIAFEPFEKALEAYRRQEERRWQENLRNRVPCEDLARRQLITLEACQAWHRKSEEEHAKNPRFSGTMLEEYMDRFVRFNYELDRIVTRNPRACDWKKIPITIRAMSVERKRLEKLRIKPYSLSTIDNRLLNSDDYFSKKGGCGSPKEFFGGFQ